MSSIVAELSGARHAKAVSAPMNNQSRAGGAHRLNLPASSISSLWQWPRTCGPARCSAPRKTNDPQSPLGHALVDDEAQRYRPQWVGGERGRVRPRLRASAGVPRLEESASVQHVLCEETTERRFSKRRLRKTTEFSTTIQSIQCNIQCAPTGLVWLRLESTRHTGWAAGTHWSPHGGVWEDARKGVSRCL